jgi:hypothetical protein
MEPQEGSVCCVHLDQTIARVVELEYRINGDRDDHGIKQNMEPTPALSLGHNVAGKQTAYAYVVVLAAALFHSCWRMARRLFVTRSARLHGGIVCSESDSGGVNSYRD